LKGEACIVVDNNDGISKQYSEHLPAAYCIPRSRKDVAATTEHPLARPNDGERSRSHWIQSRTASECGPTVLERSHYRTPRRTGPVMSTTCGLFMRFVSRIRTKTFSTCSSRNDRRSSPPLLGLKAEQRSCYGWIFSMEEFHWTTMNWTRKTSTICDPSTNAIFSNDSRQISKACVKKDRRRKSFRSIRRRSAQARSIDLSNQSI
jgi:hypothetical protein